MGKEDNESGKNVLIKYKVNEKMMEKDEKKELLMKWMKENRGEEVKDEVIEGKK